MNAAFLAVAALEQVVAVPLVLRLAVGPTVCDRAVALNAFSAQVTRCAGMLVAFGLLAGAPVAFGALPTLVLDTWSGRLRGRSCTAPSMRGRRSPTAAG